MVDVNNYGSEAMAAVRAALLADAGFVDLVPGGVHDDAPADVAFPHITFGRIEVVSDDADIDQGAIVQMGLEVNLRPDVPAGGRVLALQVCQYVSGVLHRNPADLDPEGVSVWEIEVQTYTAQRLPDGGTYRGVVALQVSIDA